MMTNVMIDLRDNWLTIFVKDHLKKLEMKVSRSI